MQVLDEGVEFRVSGRGAKCWAKRLGIVDEGDLESLKNYC